MAKAVGCCRGMILTRIRGKVDESGGLMIRRLENVW